jgi:magnesium and cobalt transporter
MGSSNDGPVGVQDASNGDPQEPEQRSFLGRIFGSRTQIEGAQDTVLVSNTQNAPPGAVPHGIANLRRLRVDDVAIPKVEVIAVPSDIGRDDLVAVFREHGFSRVPVYKGTLDHPMGLILLKDLALQHGFRAGGRFSLRKMLRPILYAPPSMPVGVLLQKMQKDRVHMALVIDEYGGVDGLVTIEDLIETVIGEIEDEHDEDEGALWKEERPGVYLVQSTAPLDEFENVIGMRLRQDEEDEEIDTLGGLIFLRAGRVPTRGEVVEHETGVEFEVVEADPRRLKRVRVRLPGAVASAAEATANATSER